MAHEITAQDSLVLFKDSAWHGLGTVVSDSMSPREALVKAGLDWQIGFPQSLEATFADGSKIPVTQTRPLYRLPRTSEESHIELGHFGTGFVPIQNEEIAELAYAFGADVKVESAGSLQQGRKVWFLLRGESVEVGCDSINTYMAIVNGNDGCLALGVMPTSVRVVCNNTLTMALNSAKGRMFRIAHAGNYKARIEECAQLLKQYKTVEAAFAGQVQELAAKKIASEAKAAKFWESMYNHLYGAPTKPEQENQARLVVEGWDNILQSEMALLGVDGPTNWLMANAITNDLQHRAPGRETEGWQERRMVSNMFGDNMNKSAEVMRMAMSL